MEVKKITTDEIADALLNLNEKIGHCDKETALGFRTSKKKDILKSRKEESFCKFTNEIKKRQMKK